MLNKAILESNVSQGAKLLDKQNPQWYTKIDTDILQLQDCDRCILGQLYHHYIYGLSRVDLDADDDPWFYGFNIPTVIERNARHLRTVYYDILKDAWIHEIEERQS